MWVQTLFFDQVNQQWLWDRQEPLAKLFLYDGMKAALIAFGVGLMITLFVARKSAVIKPYKSGLRIVILSLILVPACAGGLKGITNVACPRDLLEFGGNIHYAGIFGVSTADEQPIKRQRCFPAGHASGGFALLALPFLFSSARNRKTALCAAMAVGWTIGGYKMIIGDHFLSHTITTMLLAWLIINMIVVADGHFFRLVPDTTL